jgi:acetyl esterase/lipase
VKLALAWIRRHIAEYGGDPDFVCVTGGSAGGHLTALTGLSANDPAFQPGVEDVDTRVAACVPFYGVYDFTNRFGHDRRDGIGVFLEKQVFKTTREADPALFEAASPIARVHPDAPPFLVIHGANDTLAPVGEARDFVRLLRGASKNPVAYAEIPGAQHAFEIFHSLRTRQAVAGVERFLSFVHAQRGAGAAASEQPGAREEQAGA